MKKAEKILAVCQIQTVEAVLWAGGMSISTAIEELDLDSEECAKLADVNGCEWVASEIRKVLVKRAALADEGKGGRNG